MNTSKNIDIQLGYLPPQAIEIEAAILGACLLERDSISQAAEILKIPHVFYKDSNRIIWETLLELHRNNTQIDLITVTQQLRKNGKLESVGGAYYVTDLTTRVNSAAHIHTHCRILWEKYLRRVLIQLSSNNLRAAYDETEDVLELMGKVAGEIMKLTTALHTKKEENIQTLMQTAFIEIAQAMNSKNGITGVPSGFKALDMVTGGFQPSDLIIMAARPGMGKTTEVLNAARNAAIDHGKAVAIFSLEMSGVQLVKKFIAIESQATTNQLTKGRLNEQEFTHIQNNCIKLYNAPIFIDDTPGLTGLELRAKARRLKAEHDIQLIMVDYLQLMSGDGSGNREQQISEISRGLKLLAKELNVPVIALSQLSRAVETRGGDKRPMLSDLRESGSIEQDADMVVFIYRPEYYGITETEDGKSTKNLMENIIAKHRNGALATISLEADMARSRIRDTPENQEYIAPEPDSREDYLSTTNGLADF